MTEEIGFKELLSLIKIFIIENLKTRFFKFTKEYKLIINIKKFLIKEGYKITEYYFDKNDNTVLYESSFFEEDEEMYEFIIFSLKENKFYFKNVFSHKKGRLFDKLNRKYGIDYLLKNG